MKQLFAHVEWSDLLTAEIGMHRKYHIDIFLLSNSGDIYSYM